MASILPLRLHSYCGLSEPLCTIQVGTAQTPNTSKIMYETLTGTSLQSLDCV
jgi:hypothetical protein